MGRIKRKMSMLHNKKIKKAKDRLKSFDKGKISGDKLGKSAGNMLAKRLKAGYKLPAKHQSAPKKEAAA